MNANAGVGWSRREVLERLENPTGTRCPVRKVGSDRRCLQTRDHENGHDFLPDDAEVPTPARPVPPVVPDSEPVLVESLAEAVAAIRKRNWAEQVVPDSDGEVQPLDLSDDERAGLLTALDELHGPSGSGVVPDKPALAVCAICKGRLDNGHHPYCAIVHDGLSSHVAVTDDEAAERVISLALNDNPVALNDLDLNELALDVVAALRSAGFLIVHPMQRGPEDPTFVMPDITAVHHTKET